MDYQPVLQVKKLHFVNIMMCVKGSNDATLYFSYWFLF